MRGRLVRIWCCGNKLEIGERDMKGTHTVRKPLEYTPRFPVPGNHQPVYEYILAIVHCAFLVNYSLLCVLLRNPFESEVVQTEIHMKQTKVKRFPLATFIIVLKHQTKNSTNLFTGVSCLVFDKLSA